MTRHSSSRTPAADPAKLDPKAGLPASGRVTRALIQKLKEHLTEGLADEELARVLGLSTVQRLETLKSRMYQAEQEALDRKAPIQLFVDYRIFVESCIRRLDEVADACLAGNQAAGAVGAVKAKADLFDRVLTRGQELGVLVRKPQEVHVVGRIDVRNLSTEELARMVEEENQALRKLAASLGMDGSAVDAKLIGPASSRKKPTSKDRS